MMVVSMTAAMALRTLKALKFPLKAEVFVLLLLQTRRLHLKAPKNEASSCCFRHVFLLDALHQVRDGGGNKVQKPHPPPPVWIAVKGSQPEQNLHFDRFYAAQSQIISLEKKVKIISEPLFFCA